MAKTIPPDALIAGLKRRGAKYHEYPGWRERSRPRDTGQRRGGVVHHTGGGSASPSYLYFLFVEGRPDDGIPGPLCNVATAPDGTLHLGAAGRANHAGNGSRTTLDHVTAEDYAGYTRELEPGPDNEDGNDWLYGNEIIYSGTTPPTAAAYHAALIYAAVICEYHGWSALSWIGHHEWTDRKDDPFGFKMYKFRTDLDAMLKAPVGGSTPVPPKEVDDVALTQAQELAIAKAGWLADQFAQGAQFETDLDTAIANGNQAEVMLSRVALKDQVDALQAQVSELKTLLGQVLAKLPPTT